MDGKKATGERYIKLLNEELKMQPQYEDGMEFFAYPLGATGVSIRGYAMGGPFPRSPAYLAAAHAVDRAYIVD